MSFDYVTLCNTSQTTPAYSFANCEPAKDWTQDCKNAYACDKLQTFVHFDPNSTDFHIEDRDIRNCIYNKFFENNIKTPPSGYHLSQSRDDLLKYKNECGGGGSGGGGSGGGGGDSTSTSNTGMIIGIVAAVLIVGGGVGYYMYRRNKK